MTDPDYIMVPKYQIDLIEDIITKYLMCLPMDRRVHIMSQFCTKCGELLMAQPHHRCKRGHAVPGDSR
jgi:hypothetical protein